MAIEPCHDCNGEEDSCETCCGDGYIARPVEQPEFCEFCGRQLTDCHCCGVAYEPDDSAEQWPASWEVEW